jgi:septation ring formation regulator EzrA
MLALQDVERRLARAQFTFSQTGNASRPVSSSTARRQVENAHRVKLRIAVKGLEREREEAKADLERAESRLQEIDRRLDELSKIPEET